MYVYIIQNYLMIGTSDSPKFELHYLRIHVCSLFCKHCGPPFHGYNMLRHVFVHVCVRVCDAKNGSE